METPEQCVKSVQTLNRKLLAIESLKDLYC